MWRKVPPKLAAASEAEKGTLPKTNSIFAPENRPGPKRKRSYSNHPFSGALAVSFREGIHLLNCYKKYGEVY